MGASLLIQEALSKIFNFSNEIKRRIAFNIYLRISSVSQDQERPTKALLFFLLIHTLMRSDFPKYMIC